jgi:hypothetical protein
MAARQKISIDFADNGDGFAAITIGIVTQNVPVATLFDRR